MLRSKFGSITDGLAVRPTVEFLKRLRNARIRNGSLHVSGQFLTRSIRVAVLRLQPIKLACSAAGLNPAHAGLAVELVGKELPIARGFEKMILDRVFKGDFGIPRTHGRAPVMRLSQALSRFVSMRSGLGRLTQSSCLVR